MFRVPSRIRPHLAQVAKQYGFAFCTIDNEVYWDESAYYQFSLKQIEQDIEAPTLELEQMCLELVAEAVNSEALLRKLAIPEPFWQAIAHSWHSKQPSLYGRLDFSYNGHGPAKLLEHNADTPTSLYEAAFFQWLWLEDGVQAGWLPRRADQFNSIQEQLIARLAQMNIGTLYFSAVAASEEDVGTVQYMQDCALQAGITARFIALEDIGLNHADEFVDLDERFIPALFKLYPWEEIFLDPFAQHVVNSKTQFIEPMWKAILSNKGILPLLWQRYKGHPNLLPAYFEGEEQADLGDNYVRKPLFSREGANITWHHSEKGRIHESGHYGKEGYIVQGLSPLPTFGPHHTMIGSWLVGHQPCGLTVREDNSPITKDSSRFVPHIILD